MITDNEILLNAAKRNYDKFYVPTRLVEYNNKKRYYTNEQKADLDIKTSVNLIGEIINLSAVINCMIWDKLNNGASFDDIFDMYCDVAQLDVMSNIEIENRFQYIEICA